MADQAEIGSGEALTQDGRLLGVTTPLGKDVLLLQEVAGDESLSELFSFHLLMMSKNQDIQPEQLVGKAVDVRINQLNGGQRWINGYVSRMWAGGLNERDLREYRAEIVPWLWLLTRTTDCKIFQNKSPLDVIEQVFKDNGFTDFETTMVSDRGPTLEYIVQYRETAYNFVARWLEELGIFYCFRHQQGKHTLVLADKNSACKAVAEGQVNFRRHDPNEIASWVHDYSFRSGKTTQTDYNFETPSSSLLTTTTTTVKLPDLSNYELFDYPGRYTKKNYGDQLTRRRIEDEEATYHSVSGASQNASFFAGGKFTVTDHEIASEKGKDYVLHRVKHFARVTNYWSTPTGTKEDSYTNTFIAVPFDTVFRPQRVTPRPFVHGPQTAVVVGPSGEKIYPDKYGRVKVQFFWDRVGQKDENSSCWIRVSQNWAGKNWGGLWIPHIGHEVIVSFLEGDPDRPLITGRVYHAENMQVIKLPDDKTQSGLQDNAGNYFIWESKEGSEDIRLNAVKDQNFTVKNDYNETVKEGNRTIKIQKGTHTETIEGDTSITINTGNSSFTVNTGKHTETIKDNTSVTVQTGSYSHEVSANTATRSSLQTFTCKSEAADVQISAATQIVLSVGANSITISQSGISISGMMISETADTTFSMSGDAEVSITGGMVMINS